LEQVRLRSFVLGDIPLEKSAAEAAKESNSLSADSAKKSISTREQFAKINRELRRKPAET